MEPKSKQKSSLRTSREVYFRLKWDPLFDEGLYVIGYLERFSGLREVPLSSFQADGEVPWHRVWYIRSGNTYVWDRKERVDLVFGSGETTKRQKDAFLNSVEALSSRAPTSSVEHTGFHSMPIYRYEQERGAWASFDSASLQASYPPGVHSVLSWNVLFELYDAEQIYSEERWATLFHWLEHRDVALVGLVEVTDRFLEALLEQSWVRQRYFVSELPGGSTVQPYGQIFLSRFPFQLWHHAFSVRKHVVCAQINSSTLVSLVHLSSNREKDAELQRVHQVETILSLKHDPRFLEVKDWLILGDFNIRFGDRLESVMAHNQFVDLWGEHGSGSEGYTFLPSANSLASLNSRTGRPGRLDRWFLSSEYGSLKVHRMNLVGEEPYTMEPSPRYISDHAGVWGEVSFDCPVEVEEKTVFHVDPVVQSALALIPPTSIWEPIQAIRRQSDPSFERWMPHINLLYGFVPETYFEEAAVALQSLLKDFMPFEVTFRGFRTFTHRKTTTLWLHPETKPSGILEELQSRLQQSFPLCTTQSSRGREYTPHLTVAKWKNSVWPEAKLLLQRWQSEWEPVSFSVDAAHLISRRDNHPFAVRKSVSFSGGERWIDALQDACASVNREVGGVRYKRTLWPYGSYALGCHIEGSDLDLVWIGPDWVTQHTAFEHLLLSLDSVDSYRIISGAAITYLHLVLEGRSIDLVYVGLPPNKNTLEKSAWSEHDLGSLKPSEQRGIKGVWDAHELQDIVSSLLPLSLFQEVLRMIKRWATSRGIVGLKYGFLNGIAWSICAAYSFQLFVDTGRRVEARALLESFFSLFASWSCSKVVSLQREGEDYRRHPKRDKFVVLSLSSDLANLAPSVTNSTWNVLLYEFSRATQVMKKGSSLNTICEELCTPFVPQKPWIRFCIEGQSIDELKGWCSAQLVRWLIQMERCSLSSLRPSAWVKTPKGEMWTVSLEESQHGALQNLEKCVAQIQSELDMQTNLEPLTSATVTLETLAE